MFTKIIYHNKSFELVLCKQDYLPLWDDHRAKEFELFLFFYVEICLLDVLYKGACGTI